MEDSSYKELFDELDLDLKLREMKNDKIQVKVINITDLKKEREMFELVVSNVLDMVYGRGYNTSEELEKYLNSLIRRINDILDSNNKEKIDILLSGEFNKDAMYRGSDINEEKKRLPLYFILDLIIGILEKNNADDYYENKDNIKKIILEFKELRAKTSTLRCSDNFKPLEVIDDYTLDRIIENKGLFELEEENKDGLTYMAVSFGASKSKEAIYHSDKEKLNDAAYEKSNENVERLNVIVKKYFKKGELPSVGNFRQELIDTDINPAIKSALLSICINKSRFIFIDDLANSVSFLLNKIENIENTLTKSEKVKTEEVEKEDLDIKITLARLRYRQKSSLWKFFHKKLNPDNLNFNNMTEEEIDSLYRGR